ARQPRPFDRVLAFLDPLLARAALVVERDHALGRARPAARAVFHDILAAFRVSSLVSIGAVGIHGQPWPEVSRPVWASAGGQLRALNRLRAEALGDLAIGIDAGETDGPISDRGTAGALDRVAQMADRKYCRPHACPFRLGRTRVL